MGRGVISHKDFVRDLKRGGVGEEIVQEFVRREFKINIKQVGGSNRHWDFELLSADVSAKGKKFTKKDEKKLITSFKKKFGETLEVKYDEAAAKYKRFFVELLFDIDRGVAGAATKCKADIVVWVVPDRKGWYKLYFFKRPEFLSWVVIYSLENKDTKLKTPGISPKARGMAIPIEDLKESFAFIGEYEFKF